MPVENSLRDLSGQKSLLIISEFFIRYRTYGNLRFKGVVSDHRSTASAVAYIGFGIKIPNN